MPAASPAEVRMRMLILVFERIREWSRDPPGVLLNSPHNPGGRPAPIGVTRTLALSHW
ncbi:hypothetical protein GCM10009839_08960 [Catenulispora yoronensis]|uniref:Uncharacterized protein n=1 Tax=Catenulispora yoronensis TaxID=450799 RepID=A0ABN2TPZ8_9ACTN